MKKLIFLLAFLLPAIASAQWDKGFNFRATSGYVTDGANQTYVLGDAYPTTRNSVTFGWTASLSDPLRDRDNMVDPRLAGINQIPNNTPKDFRIDLPAAGGYTVYIALGDAVIDQPTAQYLEIFDDTTSKLVINDTDGTLGGNFDDANGTNRTSAAWPTDNVGIGLSFATTTMYVTVGKGSGSGNSTIAHIRVVQNTTGSAVAIIGRGDM